MELLVISLTIIASLAMIVAALIFGKRSGFGASDAEMADLREESRKLEESLVEALSDNSTSASKGQIEHLRKQAEEFASAVSEQRAALKDISDRIASVRADVEHREAEQQELRALKEEDEAAIARVIAAYGEFSTESVALEQKLAESLRSLDAMSGEIKMNADQRAVFSELSNALTAASAQLRDVIIDYQNANERLEGLRARFADLEKEYSKLVEQQLGA